MRTSAFLAALGIATFLGLPAAAQDADQVKAALKKKLPEAPIESVRKVPYAGLYEVTAGGDVKLAGLTPDIETIFEITRLHRVFSIHPSVDAALDDFRTASKTEAGD